MTATRGLLKNGECLPFRARIALILGAVIARNGVAVPVFQQAPGERLRFKTRVLAAVVILSNVLGNFFLSRGMRGRHSLLAVDGWVVLGVTLLIVWMLSRMTLLSWADLSYVLPVTALGYVLTVLMGRVFLLEHVSWQRWLGTLVIVGGVQLVERTPIATTPRHKAQP